MFAFWMARCCLLISNGDCAGAGVVASLLTAAVPAFLFLSPKARFRRSWLPVLGGVLRMAAVLNELRGAAARSEAVRMADNIVVLVERVDGVY